ncbi:MAG: EVE domain-containing protein [Thermoanaerobaculia bacterium]|jgi:predicted RNA-binding protein with PUA-like domain
MADWLVKTEPGEYSFEDLKKQGTATWDGVANPVAVRNIRSMKVGDRVVVYHTGGEKAAVGLARVASAPRDDSKNPKLAVLDLEAGKRLPRPVPLGEIKSSSLFAESPLVRIGRLSVVPLTSAQYAFLAKG